MHHAQQPIMPRNGAVEGRKGIGITLRRPPRGAGRENGTHTESEESQRQEEASRVTIDWVLRDAWFFRSKGKRRGSRVVYVYFQHRAKIVLAIADSQVCKARFA